MTFDEIVALVSEEISRGAQLDALIPSRVNAAIRWIEGEYSLNYMWRFVEATLVADCRVVLLPARPKEIEFTRLVDDGDYTYIPKVDPQQVSSSSAGTPNGYWIDGVQYIRFDDAPAADQPFEMYYAQFTDLLEGTDTHWLFDNNPFFVVYHTMTLMAGPMRDMQIKGLYESLRDAQLHSMTIADEAFTQGDMDPRQEYTGGV